MPAGPPALQATPGPPSGGSEPPAARPQDRDAPAQRRVTASLLRVRTPPLSGWEARGHVLPRLCEPARESGPGGDVRPSSPWRTAVKQQGGLREWFWWRAASASWRVEKTFDIFWYPTSFCSNSLPSPGFTSSSEQGKREGTSLELLICLGPLHVLAH